MAQVYTVNLVAKPLMRVKIPEINEIGIIVMIKIVAGTEWYVVEYFIAGQLVTAELHSSMLEVLESKLKIYDLIPVKAMPE